MKYIKEQFSEIEEEVIVMEQEAIHKQRAQKGVIKVIQGDKAEVMNALYYMAFEAVKSKKVIIIDAASAFNPHAMLMRNPQQSNEMLENFSIARPLTLFQFVFLFNRLDMEIQNKGASMIIITGINSMFANKKKREIKSVVPEMLEKIKELKKQFNVSFFDSKHKSS